MPATPKNDTVSDLAAAAAAQKVLADRLKAARQKYSEGVKVLKIERDAEISRAYLDHATATGATAAES